MVAINWQPGQEDLDWTRNLIRMMRDGGRWGHPATGNVYVFRKQAKELEFVHGDAFHELHQNTVKVFEALGWQVVDKRDE